MSPSPIANRSFLHGDGKTPPSMSPRMIYATLDSLALKRTRLPLRLLPIDDSDETVARSIGRGRDKGRADTCPSAEPHYSKGHSERNPRENSHSDQSTKLGKSAENKSANSVYDAVGFGNEHVYGKINFARNVVSLDGTKTTNNGVSDIVGGVAADLVDDDPSDLKLVDFFPESPSNVEDFSVLPVAHGAPYLERRTSNSSSDYESIDVTNCADKAYLGFEEISTMCENEERSIVLGKNAKEGQTLWAGKMFGKSKSVNDLWTKNSVDMVEDTLLRRMYMIEEDAECPLKSQLYMNEQTHVFVQKKRHFARNVLYFVPSRLGKGPNAVKKKKKVKKKKQHKFSSSLSSLKSLPADSKAMSHSFKPKSLSKEELKYLTISLPTNFVHVASATNPNLISNENAEGSNLERVVITHEEKCATLPLLVKKDCDWNVRNKSFHRAKDATRIHTDDATTTFHEERTVELIDKENGKAIREEVETESTRSGKMLEESQEMKRHGEKEGSPQGETCYETMCEFESTSARSSPRANSSFLWGGQAKKMVKSKNEKSPQLAPKQNDDETDAEQYDDVGVAELSQDVDYDDVGSPQISTNDNEEAESVLFNSELYDDVVSRNADEKSLFTISLREKECPTRAIDGNAHENMLHNVQKTGKTMQGDENEEDYLSINDEYSSVDEDLEEAGEEQDVYDDVGLPSQERVNSLYAGFAAGSILGMATASSKESEWEDLEDPVVFSYLAPKNNSRAEMTDGQIQGGRRKSGRGWSQKVRRQRSRGSRKFEGKGSEESTVYGKLAQLRCIAKRFGVS
ncbi:hypothetical protein KM043_001761 [Ampulex compressa]|nr:hypothetical protein KM043_001761 [Ampulex compressa]